jgi:GST-like protein
MGIIEPTSKSVRELRGLHLYHAGISNCSMRVRIALDEKQLPWESHHLDLTKGETHTPEYFEINPYGVVPTLVDDGVVIIESDDIIEYIDEHYPAPPLRPQDPKLRAQVHEWLKLATGMHVRAVKTWIYQNKMRGKLAMSDADWEEYRKRQNNEELLAFHAKSRSAQGFSAEEVAAAKQQLDASWGRAEQALSKSHWLAGEQFSLADIAWVPLHFTLIGANFDFAPYPAVQRWAARLHERRSFQECVLRCCPKF